MQEVKKISMFVKQTQAKLSQTGMTLIELMIVVAIVAIIAAIAYPSFTQQVQSSRRTEAKNLLLQVQTMQERFFTQNNTYAGSMTALGFGNDNEPTENGHYTVSITAAAGPPPTFTLTATAIGAQAPDLCGNLGINSLGVKCAVGGAHCSDGNAADQAVVNQCW